MLLDALKDIVKHTSSLGFIEMVKVIGTATDLKIETKDPDNTVIIFGSMYQPEKDIESTFGLSRMGVLKGFIGMHDKSTLTVVSETRNNVAVPTEITFDNKAGFVSSYRFMAESMINEQIKVPPFKGATWDVTITPSKAAVSFIGDTFGILGGYEKRFIVSVDKGTLNFNIGTGPTDRTTVPFATGVSGTLKHQWTYPLSQVLAVLKLADTASSATMSFSDMGALKIDIDSGIGKYSYILPAGKS
jgi:hypothetical protein